MEGGPRKRKERFARVEKKFNPAPSGLIDPNHEYRVVFDVEGDNGTPAERAVNIPHGVLDLSDAEVANPDPKMADILEAVQKVEQGKSGEQSEQKVESTPPTGASASDAASVESEPRLFDWHRWLKHEFYSVLKTRIRINHADEDINSFLDEVEGMLDEDDAARENLAKKRKDIRNIEIPSTQKKNESDEKFQERKERAWQSKLRTLATDFPPYVYVLEKLFPEVDANAAPRDLPLQGDPALVADAAGDSIPDPAADIDEEDEVPPAEPSDSKPQLKAPLSSDDHASAPAHFQDFGSIHNTAAIEKKTMKPHRFIPLWALPFLAPFAVAWGMGWMQVKYLKAQWWASGKAVGAKEEKGKGGGGADHHPKKEKKEEKKDDHGHHH